MPAKHPDVNAPAVQDDRFLDGCLGFEGVQFRSESRDDGNPGSIVKSLWKPLWVSVRQTIAWIKSQGCRHHQHQYKCEQEFIAFHDLSSDFRNANFLELRENMNHRFAVSGFSTGILLSRHP